MFVLWCVFFGGVVILIGMWFRFFDCIVEFWLLIIEIWCWGDDGGFSFVLMGFFNSVIFFLWVVLFEVIKFFNLELKGFGVMNNFKVILGFLWLDIWLWCIKELMNL